MISQSPPLDSPVVVPFGASARPGPAAQNGLVIGALALPPRDATVLRALVRLLDGSLGVDLRYSEDIAGCHVVFVSPSAPPLHPARTTVVVTEAAVVPLGTGYPITVSSPLRMTGVISALRQALSRSRPVCPMDRSMWLSTLFARLRAALNACGHSVLPVGAGQLLYIDTVSLALHTTMPIERLLSQAHRLGVPRVCTAVDAQVLQGAAAHSLSAFLWRLSAAMVEAKAPHPPLRSAWRLLRWPQAVGLMAPGHPHMAALLARRPYTALELADRTGLPLPTVSAFMLTCDALGLGQAQEPADSSDAARGAATSDWFRQLRERLKLW